jgi:hypothetical protein
VPQEHSLTTLILTFSLPTGTFEVLLEEKKEKIFIPLILPTNTVSNFDGLLSFTVVGEVVPFLSFDVICFGDAKTAIIPQDTMNNLFSYRFQGKTELIFKNTAQNSLKTNYYIFVQSYDEESEVWKKISKRLEYLDKIYDEEENKGKYQSTKRILLDVLQCFKLKQYPLIGINDNGQVGAEWHDSLNFKIISVIPRSTDDISFSYINKTGKMFHTKKTLAHLKFSSIKELLVPLKEISW